MRDVSRFCLSSLLFSLSSLVTYESNEDFIEGWCAVAVGGPRTGDSTLSSKLLEETGVALGGGAAAGILAPLGLVEISILGTAEADEGTLVEVVFVAPRGVEGTAAAVTVATP
jgi:hypothetical protein